MRRGEGTGVLASLSLASHQRWEDENVVLVASSRPWHRGRDRAWGWGCVRLVGVVSEEGEDEGDPVVVVVSLKRDISIGVY